MPGEVLVVILDPPWRVDGGPAGCVNVVVASSRIFVQPDKTARGFVHVIVIAVEYFALWGHGTMPALDESDDRLGCIAGPDLLKGNQRRGPRLGVWAVVHEEIREVRHGDSQIGSGALPFPAFLQADAAAAAVIGREDVLGRLKAGGRNNQVD